MSHPSRVRELKHTFSRVFSVRNKSHPSRVRELKLNDTEEIERGDSRTPPGCVN